MIVGPALLSVISVFIVFAMSTGRKDHIIEKYLIGSSLILLWLLTSLSWLIVLIMTNNRSNTEAIKYSYSFISSIISSILSFLMSIIILSRPETENTRTNLYLVSNKVIKSIIIKFEKLTWDMKILIYPLLPFIIFVHVVSIVTSYWFEVNDSHSGLFTVYGEKTANFPGTDLFEQG